MVREAWLGKYVGEVWWEKYDEGSMVREVWWRKYVGGSMVGEVWWEKYTGEIWFGKYGGESIGEVGVKYYKYLTLSLLLDAIIRTC